MWGVLNSLICSSLELLIDSAEKLVLGVLANVELSTEVLHDLLGDLSFEHSEQLDVLTAVELNFENADWLFLHLWWHLVLLGDARLDTGVVSRLR